MNQTRPSDGNRTGTAPPPGPPPINPITEAASVLLARSPGSREVFVVRRSARLRFFGGFLVFPGGKVAPADAEVPLVRSG